MDGKSQTITDLIKYLPRPPSELIARAGEGLKKLNHEIGMVSGPQLRHPSASDMSEQIMDASKGKRGNRIAMFLDYDGTLSPVVNDPDRASLSDSRERARKFILRSAIVTRRYKDKITSYGESFETKWNSCYSNDSQTSMLLEETVNLEKERMDLWNHIGSGDMVWKYAIEETKDKFEILIKYLNRVFEGPSTSGSNNRDRLEIVLSKLNNLYLQINKVCMIYNCHKLYPDMPYHQELIKEAYLTEQSIQINQTLGQSIDNKAGFDAIEMQEKENREHQEPETGKMESGQSLSPHHVIDIKDKNEATELTNKSNTILEFLSRGIQHSSTELRATQLASLFGVQIGQIWTLGNPFDKISQSTTSSKDTHTSLLSFGQAFSMLLPAITWSAMFLLNFGFSIILAWSLPFRGPSVSMLLISLVYYFSATSKMLDFSVQWGLVKMPGPLFAYGWAFGFVLLTSFLIYVVLRISRRYIPKLER